MNNKNLILVPYPKKMEIGEGQFAMDRAGAIAINSTDKDRVFTVACRLKGCIADQARVTLPVVVVTDTTARWNSDGGTAAGEGLASDAAGAGSAAGIAMLITGGTGAIGTVGRTAGNTGVAASAAGGGNCDPGAGRIVFVRKEDLPSEGYEIDIRPTCIRVAYTDPAGAFHAVSTLKQIIFQCGRKVPCLRIEDSPDFRARGFMVDISRLKIPTMETLFRHIDMMADLKYNQMQFYIENSSVSFAYPSCPETWRNGTPVTGEEVVRLDRYCRERFIEFVPYQDSLGRLGAWLGREEYADLAELPGGGLLNPLDPRSLDLLTRVYDDLLPHFTSRTLHVGCDEVVLGRGKTREACEKHGQGQVYLDYLLKVYELLKQRGITMMFWGDIVSAHPELLGELPKDIVACNWGYEGDYPFDSEGAAFQEAGIPYYVCPGTSSWCSITGRTSCMRRNIRSAATNGRKHGAIGFLVTDWGDLGFWQYPAASYPGFVYAAGLSWDAANNADMDIAAFLNEFIFRDGTGTIGQVILDLGDYYLKEEVLRHNITSSGYALHHDYAFKFDGLRAEAFDNVIAYVDDVLSRVSSSEMQCEDAELVYAEICNGARLVRHGAKLVKLKIAWETGEANDGLNGVLEEMIIDLTDILARFQKLWLCRNRLGGLDESVADMKFLISDYEKRMRNL